MLFLFALSAIGIQPSWDSIVQQTVVISLADTRGESARRQSITRLFNAAGVTFDFFDAFTPAQTRVVDVSPTLQRIRAAVLQEAPGGEHGGYYFARTGFADEVERSIALSHAAVWEMAAAAGTDEDATQVTLILEDDAAVAPRFTTKADGAAERWRGAVTRTLAAALTKPASGDLVMLGWCQEDCERATKVAAAPALLKLAHPLCAHAYALTPLAARTLLRAMHESPRPSDHVIAEAVAGAKVRALGPSAGHLMVQQHDKFKSSHGTDAGQHCMHSKFLQAGTELAAKNEWASALSQFRRAVFVQPHSAAALTNHAVVLAVARQHGKAVAELRRAAAAAKAAAVRAGEQGSPSVALLAAEHNLAQLVSAPKGQRRAVRVGRSDDTLHVYTGTPTRVEAVGAGAAFKGTGTRAR